MIDPNPPTAAYAVDLVAVEPLPIEPEPADETLVTATGIEVDALYDGSELYIGGVMEDVEGTGTDPALALPPVTLGRRDVERVRAAVEDVARVMGIRGLVHVRFALASDVLHLLAADPRMARTVPFVSKATGVQLARAAARIALGASIAELRDEALLPARGDSGTPGPHAPIAVRVAVPPSDAVMGVDDYFGAAYAKAKASAGIKLPTAGRAFVSVAHGDTRSTLFPIKTLVALGFEVLAPEETAAVLRRYGIPATLVRHDVEGEVDLIVSTAPTATEPSPDARAGGVPCVTTAAELAATVRAIEALVRPPSA
ncbi:hypothetical protein ABH926_001420 [Catenulispora sp. GP43]|uniref:ATP-binding protein n=1 Tax=Catenulispora sp. GP43 TaxID=3156263 RepID=UPI003513617F